MRRLALSGSWRLGEAPAGKSVIVGVLAVATLLAGGAVAQSAEIVRPPGANPLERGYEKVTPEDKGGGSVGGIGYDARGRAAVQGDSLLFSSALAFAGSPSAGFPNYYEARREASGWSVSPALPASRSTLANWYAISAPGRTATTVFADDTLSTQLVETTAAIAPMTQDGVASIFRSSGAGAFDLLTPGGPSLALATAAPLVFGTDLTPAFHASTPTGSHVLFRSSWDWPDRSELNTYDPDDFARMVPPGYLYQTVGGEITLIGVDEAGNPLPNAAAGSFPGSVRNAVTPDASRIYYTEGDGIGTLYVRETSSATAERVAGDATFIAATPDGSKALYEAQGATPGAYIYDFATNQSELISGDGEQVSVVAASDDLRRVYFAARNYTGGPSVPLNVPSIYLWDEGDVAHVATMSDDRDEQRTGIATEMYMAPPIVDAWINRWYVGWTPDANTLVFDTTANVNGYDARGYRQVYRYDADANQLKCLSCPRGAPTGNAELNSRQSLVGTHPRPMGPRGNVTRDGDQVFFHTPDALAPEDSNGTYDVYAADRDGTLHLISNGSAGEPARFVAASGDGGDVYFATGAQLLDADRDDLVDIYDARAGGGTPQSTESKQRPCEGDECQGATTGSPSSSVPATESVDADGSEPYPAEPTLRVRALTARQLRLLAKGRSVAVTARVSEPGSLMAVGTARIGRRQRIVASARTVALRAGSVKLVVGLTPAARRALRRTRALRVRLTIEHEHVLDARTLRVTVRQKARSRAPAPRAGEKSRKGR